MVDPDKIVDPEKIKALVEMMAEYELSEIALKSGDHEIRLTRPRGHATDAQHFVPHAALSAPAPVHAASAPPQPAAPPPPQKENPDEGLLRIESPMVGTFYASPDPQHPPFVAEGASVSENSVVCIIEAMKVFNEIKAGVSGTVTKILVRNEEPVEYGQPLFLVRPS